MNSAVHSVRRVTAGGAWPDNAKELLYLARVGWLLIIDWAMNGCVVREISAIR